MIIYILPFGLILIVVSIIVAIVTAVKNRAS